MYLHLGWPNVDEGMLKRSENAFKSSMVYQGKNVNIEDCAR